MSTLMLVFLVCLLCASFFFAGRRFHSVELRRDLRSLAEYRRTHLDKRGWSLGYGNYALSSFDGGQNWYAVEHAEGSGLLIRGPAEEVFPGLLAHLEGLRTLSEYVQKNGPISLGGPRAAEGAAVLARAGFSFAGR